MVRTRFLLITGMLVGAILASMNLLEQTPALFIDNNSVIARVNGVEISTAQLDLIIDRVEKDRGSPLSEEQKNYFLQRLIDDELIVQRGQALGLLQLNSTLRNNMRQAVLDTLTTDSLNTTQEPSENELRMFYKEHFEIFSQKPKLKIKQYKFLSEQLAKEASGKYRESLDYTLLERASEKSIIDLPESFLSAKDLRTYIPADVIDELFELSLNQLSEARKHNGKWYVYLLIDLQENEQPEFSEINEQVKQEYLRFNQEKLIADYIYSLRKQAKIERFD